MMAITVNASAQTIGDAFYIYRNDGDFNAFFREEVDSIVYSNYDNDSIWYDDVVTQVVYTPDSIYRIPLAAIDSVGFVQPEIILQPNVIQMEKVGLMDYLQAVDGMSLIFKNSIPLNLQPRVGESLLYTQFNNPLLNEGFVGKVLSTEMTDNVFVVNCDSIYDLFEIFEQLISIERIADDNQNSSHKAKREWKSGQNELEFNLGYTHNLSDKDSVSISGFLKGTYVATVIYNFTKENQYFNLRIDHDWNYGAHFNFKHEIGSFGPKTGPTLFQPEIRFPVMAPVFKFKISGAPFVKGEGNIEFDSRLSSPVHSYVAQAIYNNGHFSGWNHKKPVQDNSSPSIETAFSLNGSVQAGIMLNLWLGLDVSIKGFAKDLLKLGAGLDFYIGPKITGDFSLKQSTENPHNFYSICKDSKIGIDWLHIDYEFFGEASLAGYKFPKAKFGEGSLQSPLNHEWYVMPDFSGLSIIKNVSNRQAIISTTPSRDILFPLEVGMGLYDDAGKLLKSKFETKKYKRENEGFEICQQFSPLEKNEEYTARPMLKFFQIEIPAEPSESFELEKAENPVTLYASDIGDHYITVEGRVKNAQTGMTNRKIGVFYNKSGEPEETNGTMVVGEIYETYEEGISFFRAKIENMQSKESYYYRAFQEENGEYLYGETRSIKINFDQMYCPDNNHPHMIDLGLPSGTKWACCSMGAENPREEGDKYMWGETTPYYYPDVDDPYFDYDRNYRQEHYKYGHFEEPYDPYSYLNYSCDYLGDCISGTEYDAAHVRWGNGWEMPKLSDFKELFEYCYIPDSGPMTFIGPNGNILRTSDPIIAWTGDQSPEKNEKIKNNYAYIFSLDNVYIGARRYGYDLGEYLTTVSCFRGIPKWWEKSIRPIHR